MTSNWLSLFQSAKNVSTPLVTIQTPDQGATVEALRVHFAADTKQITPIVTWDCIRGIQWANESGLAMLWQIMSPAAQSGSSYGQQAARTQPMPTKQDVEALRKRLQEGFADPINALEFAARCTDRAIFVMMNAHLFWEKPHFVQAAWNLRDPFKGSMRTLVFLTEIGVITPMSLRDSLPLVEALPTIEEIDAMVKEQFDCAQMKDDPGVRAAAVDALCGLASFPAEQALAMSFCRRNGALTLDLDALWERKRQAVEQTPGLSIWRGDDSFGKIGGLENIKTFLTDLLGGEEPPRLIVFIDEIEKAMAGATSEGGDSSGTTQEMHGTLLAEMQNRNYPGLILVGPAGTGKSQIAKSFAGEAKKPCVMLDLSSMKNKFVGESNANLNHALRMVYSISQGRALWIATCNSIAQLPPELKRRFSLGTFFVDLPSKEELAPIWSIYLKQFGLDTKQKRPIDDGWTGADVKACCSLAWKLRKPLLHAAEFLTPVAQTDGAKIQALRQASSGKYLSASYPGKYIYGKSESPVVATSGVSTKTKRAISIPSDVN